MPFHYLIMKEETVTCCERGYYWIVIQAFNKGFPKLYILHEKT